MDWNSHAAAWNEALIRMMDIRYIVLRKEQAPIVYYLPASGFMYVDSGQARVRFGTAAYKVQPNQLLHGPKGTEIVVSPDGDAFAYYLILYKAALTRPLRWGERRMTEQPLPFDAPYVCSLAQASLLRQYIDEMIGQWNESTPLDKLRVKAIFYRFVYELLCMMEEQERAGSKHDLSQQVVRYLQEHYREQVSMSMLAAMFNCSETHLNRQFNRQTGLSPIYYLIQLRMEHAKRLLVGSEANLKHIATEIGYSDSFYFSRMFKKHTGYSPFHYRRQFAAGTEAVPDNPLNQAGYDMERHALSAYYDNDKYYHYHKGERQRMVLALKPSSIAMTMLLCFMLLLSACQPAANTAVSGGERGVGANTGQETVAPAEQQAAKPTTRVYKHIDGETEIPLEPKRVFTDLKVGQLLALGIKPVGSATFPLQTEFFNTDGIEDLGRFPLNLEKLTALNPDLIILTEAWRDGGGYEAFNKIAPTVVIPNHAKVWSEELLMFGDMLGKTEEAKSWIAQFETKVNKAREQVATVIGKGETFSILNVRDKAFYIYSDVNMGGNILYKFLGLKPQAKVLTDVIQGEVWQISSEVIPDYIGDHLFIASSKSSVETLANNKKIWENTAAVRNGNVYDIDFDKFLLTDPLSTSHQLDIITDMLLKHNKK